uniref:Uncharacterized protein n=1 Tax=Anguilla anguilla TaxID=7936 RepID=A0A0E9VHW5_ANGAN
MAVTCKCGFGLHGLKVQSSLALPVLIANGCKLKFSDSVYTGEINFVRY